MLDRQEALLDFVDRAAEVPRRYFRCGLDIAQKADETPVTIADRETETVLRDAITARFPDDAILGEEFGDTGGGPDGGSRFRWVIDPIDGTRSFITGMPLYGMLVGLLDQDRPVLGAIAMPELREVYSGGPEGAMLNRSRPLRTSSTTRLADAFVYINEADKIIRDRPQVFARLNRAGRDRRFSCDCYPHALVAAGHVDACVDYQLQPYDYLPLVPVIEGAGGVITDWQGRPPGLANDVAVVSAATPELHAELIHLLNEG